MTPRINEFRDTAGGTDFSRWRYDIILRLLDNMDGDRSGISTREFCREYFQRQDLETVILVGQQLQVVRAMLQDRATPLLLLNSNQRWYVVSPGDPARARQFLVDRTRRMLNAYMRLGRVAEIGRTTYALPDTDGLLRAIEGSGPGMGQLREALGIEPEEEEQETNP